MLDEKDKEERRLKKVKIALMRNPKFALWSGIMMVGKTSVDDHFPSASTNGRDEWYGREFIKGLDDKELAFVVLHENLHKAFRHLFIWKKLDEIDRGLTNAACDYVINILIHDSDPDGRFVRLPKGGLLDERFRGLDAGTVFRMLEEEQSGGGGNGKEPSDGGNGTQEGGLDEHGWNDAKEMSTTEKETLAKNIDQALRQGALLAGKLGANVPREITDLLESKINWRDALRDFITSYCEEKDLSTWRKPNRRWVDRDVYLPSVIGESVGRLVIAVDTSGSIDNKVIGAFLGEVKQICRTVSPEAIDLMYWDTQVCQHEVYERDSFDALLTSTKPKGGGGTRPQCVSDYIRAKKLKPEAIIMLTDGYVSGWGTHWNAPMFWGITTKGIASDVGVTVYVSE